MHDVQEWMVSKHNGKSSYGAAGYAEQLAMFRGISLAMYLNANPGDDKDMLT